MRKIVLILFTCVSTSLFAQKGSVSGIVTDSLTNQPVEFATVAIVESGKPINGSICDDAGKFKIEKIDKGVYQLVVSFVGYTTRKINLEIKDKSEINLGALALA